jgi:hypothetical protein
MIKFWDMHAHPFSLFFFLALVLLGCVYKNVYRSSPSPIINTETTTMDEGPGDFSWPTWGTGGGRSDRDWIAACEPKLEDWMQTMEGGAAHEQIRAAVEGDGIVAMEQEGEVQPVLAVEDEPASLGAGGRDGCDRPTRRRGKVDGGRCGSKPAVPMEKDGNARPVRPRGGRPSGGGNLHWKASRESPWRPRGGGRRSDEPCYSGAIDECHQFVCLHRHRYIASGTTAGT